MPSARAARRFVVRAPNWLGDLAMATPALRALRDFAPEAHIAVQVRAELAPLLAGSPHVDALIEMQGRPRTPAHLLREMRRVREAGPFDLGVCLPDSFSSALILKSAGVKDVIGYARGRRSWLLDRAVPVPRDWGSDGRIAREIHGLTLLGALGCDSSDTRLALFTTDDEESRARAAVGDGDPVRRPVGMAPGASYGPSKQWPVQSFAALADAVIEGGDDVWLLGSPGEVALVERVQLAMKHDAISLAGRIDVGTLKAIIRRLSLLIANDAGARHVAVAFGVPVMVFMGPTAIEKTGENLQRVRVLTHDVACRPCYQRHCPIDHRCMTGITPEVAIRALTSMHSSSVEAISAQGPKQSGIPA